MQQFVKNRQQFPADELKKYAGQYVAWSPDGKSIIASAEDIVQLAAAVKKSGFDSAECVLSSVPLPDEVIVGGGSW